MHRLMVLKILPQLSIIKLFFKILHMHRRMVLKILPQLSSICTDLWYSKFSPNSPSLNCVSKSLCTNIWYSKSSPNSPSSNRVSKSSIFMLLKIPPNYPPYAQTYDTQNSPPISHHQTVFQNPYAQTYGTQNPPTTPHH